ncbi:MAG: hypothetical protein QOC80_251 [Frankiaceae bacterium]|nr:hypothetical protein [Frankiaceae bacterium]
MALNAETGDQLDARGGGGFSRRQLLRGAVGATALATFAPSAAWASRAGGAYPGLPSAETLWDWQHQLVGFGTRYTGSPGHTRFIDWIADQMAHVPGFRVQRDRKTFDRWLAQRSALSVSQPSTSGPSGPVELAYYYPYSGATPAGGVTGKLVNLGTYEPAAVGTSGTGAGAAFWAAAAGGVALVKAPPSTFTFSPSSAATGGYERGKTSAQAAQDYTTDNAVLTNPAFVGIFSPVALADAKAAGVKAVLVSYTGMSAGMVANQYNPFITPYPSASGKPAPGDPGCPAVWVAEGTGSQLARAAASGAATAHVTLTASITAGAATDTVWGVLPGTDPTAKPLIVNTHTDGPNATEENGALGMIALARYFARRRHRRPIYFAFVTGHFQMPQFTSPIVPPRPEVGSDATSVWMNDHPEIYRNAVAGLTVEHLGCRQWVDVAGGYTATGRYDWGVTYTTQRSASLSPTNIEQRAWLDALRAVDSCGHPVGPNATVQPTPLYLGEGAPLYAGGLGTVSLVPLPTYLLQAGSRERPGQLDLEKLDRNLAYAQVLAFARTIATLDAAPDAAF